MKTYCRKCKSKKITFWKKIHQGNLMKQFHYGVKCLNCKASYKVPRSKYIYERVKNQPWRYSKNAIKLKSAVESISQPI